MSNTETVLYLQRTIGNQATRRHLAATQRLRHASGANTIQRLNMMQARNFVGKLPTLDGKVPYSTLFSLWIMRPGNQEILAGIDESKLQEAIEPLTSIAMEEVEAERSELGFQSEKKNFGPTYGNSQVFQKLVAGIDISDNPATNLSKLLVNFQGVDFNYTMQAKSPDSFLKGNTTEGDCNTLVRTFEKIAQMYLGIREVKYQTSSDRGFSTRFSAPQKRTVGTPKTGNVNSGAFWVFENH